MDRAVSAAALPAAYAALGLGAASLAAWSLFKGRGTQAYLLPYTAVFGWCWLRVAYWRAWEDRNSCPSLALTSGAVGLQCIGCAAVLCLFLRQLYGPCWTHPTALCPAGPPELVADAAAPEVAANGDRPAEGCRLLSAQRAYGACETVVVPPACRSGDSIGEPVRDLSFVSPSYTSPQPLGGARCAPWRDAPVTAVAAGKKHTMLVAGGHVYACGGGQLGQLGLGTGLDFDTPQLLGPALVPWGTAAVTAVAAGEDHTVILAGGRVYACGFNRFGQLGLGHGTECDTPCLVGGPTAPWGAAPVTQIAAGEDHTLLLAGGTVYVCGSNGFGQLGLGDTANRSQDEKCEFRTLPEAIQGEYAPWGSKDVTCLAAGNKHSVVVAGGELYTCGTNDNGQLGHDSDPGRQLFRRVAGPWAAATVTAAAVGDNHTVVLAGGVAYTFGSGFNGQLGLGIRERVHTPRPLEGASAPWGNTPVTLAAASTYHTVLVAGCNVYTCGNNYHGQLGLGHTEDRDWPELLQAPPWGGDAVTAVACGRDHTAVVAGGRLYTFGYHRQGQLGVGALVDDTDPAPGSPAESEPHFHRHGNDICCFLPCPALPCGQKWEVRISVFHYVFCAAVSAGTLLALAGGTWLSCLFPSATAAFDLDRWGTFFAYATLLLSFSWCCNEALQQPLPRAVADVDRHLARLAALIVALATMRCVYGIAAPWLGKVVSIDDSGTATSLPVAAFILELLWYLSPAVAVLGLAGRSTATADYRRIPSDDES